VEETMTATPANGNHYADDSCFVFELQEGRVHRVREYMDTLVRTAWSSARDRNESGLFSNWPRSRST
jgi:ketosteroid isomerase-like protein